MFSGIQIGSRESFAPSLVMASFGVQYLGQNPVRFEPIGMRLDSGSQAQFRAGLIVLVGAQRREAVPGAKRRLRSVCGPLPRGDGLVDGEKAQLKGGSFAGKSGQRSRVPKIVGMVRAGVMRGG